MPPDDFYVQYPETQKILFQEIYNRLLNSGQVVQPRGLKVIEVENFSYELPPFVRFTNFTERKLSIDYIKREFLWYLKGDLYDLSICEHAAIWRGLIVDGRLNSNYGHYAFRRGGMQWCYDELVNDKDSRRASLVIIEHAAHCNPRQKDVPCTAYINFRIRRGYLNMSVHMRSQDAIYGMSNDIPAFTFMHEMLWKLLAHNYPDLQLGMYYHTADSFHVYERHWEMINKLVKSDAEFIAVDCPRIDDLNEVQYLVDFYPRGVKPSLLTMPFSNWLTAVERTDGN